VEALQDQLGALNELATAPEVLARLGLADDPQAACLLGVGDKATFSTLHLKPIIR
jgi:hypothetical protein